MNRGWDDKLWVITGASIFDGLICGRKYTIWVWMVVGIGVVLAGEALMDGGCVGKMK